MKILVKFFFLLIVSFITTALIFLAADLVFVIRGGLDEIIEMVFVVVEMSVLSWLICGVGFLIYSLISIISKRKLSALLFISITALIAFACFIYPMLIDTANIAGLIVFTLWPTIIASLGSYFYKVIFHQSI